MKQILLFIVAFTVSASMFAQHTTMPEKLGKVKDRLDPAAIAGLDLYDANTLFTALKIKKTSKKGALNSLINSYNEDIKQLKGENMGILIKLGSDLKTIFSNQGFRLKNNAQAWHNFYVLQILD